MKNQSKTITTGVEVLKTVTGVVVGRYATIMGGNVLKIAEEADPKKAKMKKLAVGGGVLAIGTIGAIKAPNQFKSVFAGIATAGALAIATPFATDDKGFIPALHGSLGTATIEDEDDERILMELNSPYSELLDQEEQEEEENDSYYRSGRRVSGVDTDFEEMNNEMN
ncbi:hypothetical protein [Labilibaculum antarcticum]|uniref:Uncharacterized protein n=1 Tax=Labilibaculum antarcticum TaxID=1717717 RepID=A0A1Y1CFE0_9BACT|nr:hypothetical protein [Labilibaculum antarcticum]BAX79045.1 hypothetical protein ALGA_0656 [Labilibaculum antarcticum]